MTIDNKLSALLDVASNDVPARHRSVPLASIHNRLRRRRRTAVFVVAAAVVSLIAGGFSLQQRMVGQPPPQVPAVSSTPSPAADDIHAIPWLSAMVNRTGSTVTVYVEAPRCKDLWHAGATVSEQNASEVVIGVTGRFFAAADCAGTALVVPLVVTLATPLGDRAVHDANTDATAAPAIYFERYLPDVRADSRWTPVGARWSGEGWHEACNGPNGSELTLHAGRTGDGRGSPESGTTIMLGPHQAKYTERVQGRWTAWWEVGDITYSLVLAEVEGSGFTLAQFKQELARLTWS